MNRLEGKLYEEVVKEAKKRWIKSIYLFIYLGEITENV